MSNYLEKYQRRILRHGEDVGDALSNDTVDFINQTFTHSTTYHLLNVRSELEGTPATIDSRVVQVERLGSLREIILRPNETLPVGAMVQIGSDWYLLFDKYGGLGSSSVKLTAIVMNQTLKWENADGVEKAYLCVASGTDLGSKSKQGKTTITQNKYDVKLPSGQLLISVETNPDTLNLTMNQRFILGRNVYEVIGIDDVSYTTNGYGIVQLTLQLVPKTSQDNFETGIAYNAYKDNGTLIPLEEETSKKEEEPTKGSGLW